MLCFLSLMQEQCHKTTSSFVTDNKGKGGSFIEIMTEPKGSSLLGIRGNERRREGTPQSIKESRDIRYEGATYEKSNLSSYGNCHLNDGNT